jgi:hypothetical protein
MVNKKSLTKDEMYLVKLKEIALSLGDVCHEVDRYVVGRGIGQNSRSVDNIVRMLAQANFVKKGEGESIYLTPNGLALIESLR